MPLLNRTLVPKIERPGYVPTPRVPSGTLLGIKPPTETPPPAAVDWSKIPPPQGWYIPGGMTNVGEIRRGQPWYFDATGKAVPGVPRGAGGFLPSQAVSFGEVTAATPPPAAATPPPEAATPALDALTALTKRLKGVQPVENPPQPLPPIAGSNDNGRQPVDNHQAGRVRRPAVDNNQAGMGRRPAVEFSPKAPWGYYEGETGSDPRTDTKSVTWGQDILAANKDAAGRVAPPSAVLMRDEDAIRRAQRLARIKMRSRQGRASTILSRERLG